MLYVFIRGWIVLEFVFYFVRNFKTRNIGHHCSSLPFVRLVILIQNSLTSHIISFLVKLFLRFVVNKFKDWWYGRDRSCLLSNENRPVSPDGQNQRVRLSPASRMKKLTEIVKSERETFTLFLIRLRIAADGLEDDASLSVEMIEEALQKALWDNIPKDCLPFLSTDMTPDEVVKIVDEYHNQNSSGFQYRRHQPASRLS